MNYIVKIKRLSLGLAFAGISWSTYAQLPAFDYFGLKTPGNSIELFAPQTVSLENVNEKSLAISPFGDEVFFSGGEEWPKTKIIHIKKKNNIWGKPHVFEFCADCFATEPAFSPDGKYLFFSSAKGEKNLKNYSIWRMERVGESWGKAKKIIDIPEGNVWEFHPSVAKNGSVYFCRWDSVAQTGRIFRSTFENDTYLNPEKIELTFGATISDTDPFIDPDEKYLITSSVGQKGKGGYDVYISYRKPEGLWAQPVNAGEKINTPSDENSLDISPDGRFAFIYKLGNVYWTPTKGLIDGF
jgi:Periplasmic component of the Tol biopolymer transport system